MAEKIKHKHFQKENKLPFLPPISVLPLCSQSAQPFQPLATWAEARQAIPSVSAWVRNTVRRGYSLQFARRPSAVCSPCSPPQCAATTLMSSTQRWWICWKGAIEIVPPAYSESDFNSRYFLVPKEDGGLQPILDLRLLNHTLMKRSFSMITLKQILLQICQGDWFMSLDLKDICEAAGWSSPSTFVRFYNLDVPAVQATVLSA